MGKGRREKGGRREGRVAGFAALEGERGTWETGERGKEGTQSLPHWMGAR